MKSPCCFLFRVGNTEIMVNTYHARNYALLMAKRGHVFEGKFAYYDAI